MKLNYNLSIMSSVLLIMASQSMVLPVSKYMSYEPMKLSLSLLTFILTSLCMTTTISIQKSNSLLYTTLFMFMAMLLNIVFCTTNKIMFFMMFEASMIPIFLVITFFGSNPERLQASFFMMIYTLAASFPFLGILIKSNKENFTESMEFMKDGMEKVYFPWILVIGVFMVKMPCFMLHVWLPKAHVEAPAPGSMILAGVLLKLGTYGMLKFLPLIMKEILKWKSILMSIGVVGASCVSLMCCRQSDLKVMIALSSVSHMSMTMASIVAANNNSIKGAVMSMISHGGCSAVLFFIMNIMYMGASSRSLFILKGNMSYAPNLTMSWFLACSLNMAAPPSINYMGEIFMNTGVISSALTSVPLLSVMSFMVGIYCVLMFSLAAHGENNISPSLKIVSSIENMVKISFVFYLVITFIYFYQMI